MSQETVMVHFTPIRCHDTVFSLQIYLYCQFIYKICPMILITTTKWDLFQANEILGSHLVKKEKNEWPNKSYCIEKGPQWMASNETDLTWLCTGAWQTTVQWEGSTKPYQSFWKFFRFTYTDMYRKSSFHLKISYKLKYFLATALSLSSISYISPLLSYHTCQKQNWTPDL